MSSEINPNNGSHEIQNTMRNNCVKEGIEVGVGLTILALGVIGLLASCQVIHHIGHLSSVALQGLGYGGAGAVVGGYGIYKLVGWVNRDMADNDKSDTKSDLVKNTSKTHKETEKREETQKADLTTTSIPYLNVKNIRHVRFKDMTPDEN